MCIISTMHNVTHAHCHTLSHMHIITHAHHHHTCTSSPHMHIPNLRQLQQHCCAPHGQQPTANLTTCTVCHPPTTCILPTCIVHIITTIALVSIPGWLPLYTCSVVFWTLRVKLEGCAGDDVNTLQVGVLCVGCVCGGGYLLECMYWCVLVYVCVLA